MYREKKENKDSEEAKLLLSALMISIRVSEQIKQSFV